jgi:hypothetical protein
MPWTLLYNNTSISQIIPLLTLMLIYTLYKESIPHPLPRGIYANTYICIEWQCVISCSLLWYNTSRAYMLFSGVVFFWEVGWDETHVHLASSCWVVCKWHPLNDGYTRALTLLWQANEWWSISDFICTHHRKCSLVGAKDLWNLAMIVPWKHGEKTYWNQSYTPMTISRRFDNRSLPRLFLVSLQSMTRRTMNPSQTCIYEVAFHPLDSLKPKSRVGCFETTLYISAGHIYVRVQHNYHEDKEPNGTSSVTRESAFAYCSLFETNWK